LKELPNKALSFKHLGKSDSAKSNSQYLKLRLRKKKEAPKKQEVAKPKEEKKPKKKDDDDGEEEDAEKKSKNALDDLPKSTFDLFSFKTLYVNAPDKLEALDFFWKNYDPQGFSLYWVQYIKS